MGLFDRLFGGQRSNNTAAYNTSSSAGSASAEPSISQQEFNTAVIDMSKSVEQLDKVLIDMSKGSKIDMTKHTARVALAMDYSGSMGGLFSNGSVQRTITRLLPIALKFDDNGELESWLFSTGYDSLDAVTIRNYKNYVRDVMQQSEMQMGGTWYAPVLRDMVRYYTEVEPSSVPAFVIFITDGENSDKSNTDEVIRALSECNVFVQFVGIGNASFNYLRALDDMEGRACDNTGFIAVRDMDRMSDAELYTELLRQYKDWLNSK